MNIKIWGILKRKVISLFLVIFMALNLGSFVFADYGRDNSEIPEGIVPGELIVKYKNSYNFTTANEARLGVYSKERVFNLDKGPFGLLSTESSGIASNKFFSGLDRYHVLRIGSEDNIKNVYNKLKLDPNVESVDYNYIFKAQVYPPNDPLYSTQYNLEKINAGPAIQATEGGDSDIVIAVLDTGVRGTHEDLADKVLAGYDFIGNQAISAGANSDIHGHGTAASSVAAAHCNNSKGISGVACNAKIMPIKTLNDSGVGGLIESARGVVYAVNNGAHVVNLSLGGDTGFVNSSLVNDAFRYAHEKNVVTVSASGNENVDLATIMPANNPYTITVGASDQVDSRATFSNYGAKLDFVAPGVDIPLATAVSDTAYDSWSGTSFSAPQVSGVVALMLGKNRELTAEQVRQVLRNTATDIGTAGFDVHTGYGLINAGLAVSSIESGLPSVALIDSLPNEVGTQVALKGFATGPNFSSYKIEFGSGISPSSWTQITSNSSEKTSRGSSLGTWNASSLSSGNYVLRMTVTNTDSSSQTFTLYVLVSAGYPLLAVNNPLNVKSSNPTITGSATAASGVSVAAVGYCLNPDPSCSITTLSITPANSVNFSINLSGLTEGDHYLLVLAQDAVGRTVQEDILFEVDQTPPTTPIITSPVNGSNSSLQVINLTGTAERASTVQVYSGTSLIGSVKASYNGSWTKSVTLNSGSNTLKARAVDAAGNESSFSQVVVNFSAEHFAVTSSTNSVVAGEPFSITVTVKAADGNVETGYTGLVQFTSSDAQATLPGDYTFIEGDQGVKIFEGVILKTASGQTITVTSSDRSGNSQVITVSSGSAVAIEKISGDGQAAVVNRELSSPLIVKVKDEFNNSVPSTSITKSVISGGGQISSSSDVATGSNGQASIRWKMGSSAGAASLEVSFTGVCEGGCPSVTFSATANPFTSNVTPESGSNGQIINSSDNKAGLVFPLNSVEEPVFVSIERIVEGVPASPAGKRMVSDFYNVTAEKESGGLVTTFSGTVPSMSLYFDKNKVGIKETDFIKINRWDETSSLWTTNNLDSQIVNYEPGRITANVGHFSGFAVLSSADSSSGDSLLVGSIPKTGADFFRILFQNLLLALGLQIIVSVIIGKRTQIS